MRGGSPMRSSTLAFAVLTVVAVASSVVAPPLATAHPKDPREPVVGKGAAVAPPAGRLTRVVAVGAVGSKGHDSPGIRAGDDIPVPPQDDRDRDRILRMQEMLREIVHGAILN